MKSKLLFLNVLLFCSCTLLFAQDKTNDTLSQDSTINFPDAWIGEYAGVLKVYNAKGKQKELHMELSILPNKKEKGKYSWTIQYGETAEGIRPYSLIPIKPELGVYAIDENNAIVMECFLLDDTLYQWYEVDGILIYLSVHKPSEDMVIWELVAGKDKPFSITGDTIIDGEEISPVSTFPINSLQKAKLYLKN